MAPKTKHLKFKIKTFEWTKKKINAVVFTVFIILFLYTVFAPLNWFLWGAAKIEYPVNGFANDITFGSSSGNSDTHLSVTSSLSRLQLLVALA